MEGMAKILRRRRKGGAGVAQPSRRDRAPEPVPPKVDKLWLDNIVRAEAFMGLERIWHPEKGVNNRGHMGGAPDPTAIASITTKNYRPAEEKDLPPGRNERWKKK